MLVADGVLANGNPTEAQVSLSSAGVVICLE